MRGMSLAVETTVVIVIAIVVLLALMLFFNMGWGPGIDRIKLEQQKVDLCSKYVAQDTDCKGTSLGNAIKKEDFDKMCNGLGLSTVPAICCASYCPSSAKCPAKVEGGYQYGCRQTCSSVGDTIFEGACESGKVCCKFPAGP